jgi:hypothetical protein
MARFQHGARQRSRTTVVQCLGTGGREDGVRPVSTAHTTHDKIDGNRGRDGALAKARLHDS